MDRWYLIYGAKFTVFCQSLYLESLENITTEYNVNSSIFHLVPDLSFLVFYSTLSVMLFGVDAAQRSFKVSQKVSRVSQLEDSKFTNDTF